MSQSTRDARRSEFAADVREGLGAPRKHLPPRYFYDALGSQLFEAICELPWYPITRAESELLRRHAAEIVAHVPGLAALVELGSGSGEKLALVARALVERCGEGGPGRALHVHLVDISPKAIELSRKTLSSLRGLEVVGHVGTFEEGLREIASAPPGAGSRLVLFLGSNIGNFDPPSAARLLAEVRRALRPGDGLLLGADLVRGEAELLLAYDDPLGVTAAFDKNLLQRINAELGGDFDLTAFDHRAVWNAKMSRVEAHLVSRRPQVVRIPGAGIEPTFAEGETIWTESSYKFTRAGVVEMGRAAGLACRDQWIAEEGFSTTLFLAEA